MPHTQGSNPRLAGRLPDGSGTDAFEPRLGQLAKVAAAAQTGDAAVIAVLEAARARNATNLTAFETALSGNLTAATTKASLQASSE